MAQPFQLSKPIEGEEAFVEMPDGTRIHTISSGSGKTTVLLAHAYGFSHIEWNIIVEHLHQLNYRTIVFDQRGHGKSTIGSDGISSASMASDYKNLIEHFELEDCILVGHSMGGFLLMKFLLDYPEMQHKQVKSCVLMATFAGDVNKKNFQNRLQIPLIKSGILQKLIRWKPIGQLFGRSLLGDNPDPEVAGWISEEFLKTDHVKLVPIIKAFAEESYYDRLHEISIPCTVVIGDKDATTPPFHTDDMVKSIPNTTRIDIKGKGHCLNVEAPEEIIKAIKLMDSTEIPVPSKIFHLRGFQRSGTNWVNNLLNLHPDITCKGEFHFSRFFEVKNAFINNRFNKIAKSAAFSREFENFINNTIIDICGYNQWCGDRTPTSLMSTYIPGRKNILITRDGRDCIVSWMYHCIRRSIFVEPQIKEKRAILDQNPAYFEEHKEELLDVPAFVRRFSKDWNTMIISDIQAMQQADSGLIDMPYYWVRYEELTKRTNAIRDELYRFLGADPSLAAPLNEETTPGFDTHRPEEHNRIGKAGRWVEYFTPAQHEVFLSEASEAVTLLGLPQTY